MLIETGKAARTLLELEPADLEEIIASLDDSTIAAICTSSAPDDAADSGAGRRGPAAPRRRRGRGARVHSGRPVVPGALPVAGHQPGHCISGVVPLALQRLRFDPAIASSIFATTFTDVGGFFSFLGLATLAMRFLGR